MKNKHIVVPAALILWSFFVYLTIEKVGEDSYEEKNDQTNYERKTPVVFTGIKQESFIQEPEIFNRNFDLNADGKKETFIIESDPGFPGAQYTRVYLNKEKEPTLTLVGYFDNMFLHQINKTQKVLEIRVLTGQSIDTTFYKYLKGKLIHLLVSTTKSPSYYGIVSRDYPELKDIDGDGVFELLAYYSLFSPEGKRWVELYEYNGQGFDLVKEYEEDMPEMYL